MNIASFIGIALAATALCAVAKERTSLDKDWTFILEGQASRKVDVPHDWSIEFAPSAGASTECGGGFYLAGKATYERKLKLTAEEAALPDLALDFEGVYRDSKVFVNGVEAGRGSFYGYTGFRIPLAGRVHAGDNTLRVEVDNSAQPNCRWYSGSGIVRPVWLVKGVSRKDAEAQSGSTHLSGSAPPREITGDTAILRTAVDKVMKGGFRGCYIPWRLPKWGMLRGTGKMVSYSRNSKIGLKCLYCVHIVHRSVRSRRRSH